MTSWPNERKAILNMISHFGEGVFACVMDSYDYVKALETVLPSIKNEKVEKGGYMVLRPDSGDPVEAVLQVDSPCVPWNVPWWFCPVSCASMNALCNK
jgi:nicotinamide phosphoribosyltransferase